MPIHTSVSNPSSLTTSSLTEGHHESEGGKRASIPSPSTPILLSLAASAQESNTDHVKSANSSKSGGHLSPASLDLMKCSSGSIEFGPDPSETRYDTKRPRQYDHEERDDAGMMKHGNCAGVFRPLTDPVDKFVAEETRPIKRVRTDPVDKLVAEETRTIKRVRTEVSSEELARDSKYKEVTLSVACSSPYSLSAPFPQDNQQEPSGFASSATITPMEVDGHDGHLPPGVGPSMPSWEIREQDSFSVSSAGGGLSLMRSFSFSQDFPTLPNCGSNLDNCAECHDASLYPPPSGHVFIPSTANPNRSAFSSYQKMESRNQSFEGGHYHGSFDRSESMDTSYGSHHPHGRYNGNFKPQQHSSGYIHRGPSWGSYVPPPGAQGHYGYGQYPPPFWNSASFEQAGHCRMMPGHSEERVAPPPGPPGMCLGNGGKTQGRSGFQPPPEFMAPHNPHMAKRPQQTVYLMPSPDGGYGNQQTTKTADGSFLWKKEEDIRLIDIMKSHKNPLDWEPIAKEHGRGRTAQECHKRWTRYLKPGVRKGQWMDHEDAIIIEAVTTSSDQPFTKWSDLAYRLPGRVGKQIRDRWVNHLNPEINHLPFSREDDLLLWDGHQKLGKRWVEISTKLFNSSRSENHIKNRWYSAAFRRFIAEEFGSDAYDGGKGPKKGSSSKKKKALTIKGNLSEVRCT